jgi:hypothetical protein
MDKGVTQRLFGNYRAKVVSNRDNEKYGRVLVWIPDLMPEVSDTQGIWARPANNPIGGRNKQSGSDENYYMGTSYIPRKGSWVWIFFEAGNINRPYYFGALDLQNAKVLPENQLGSNYQDKWTIFKSHEGRTIVISDDPDDARTEITGKKRELKEPPSGDTDSVYKIDDNQTTILLDERNGKQKLLIRTYQGDYLNIDIDDRKLYAEFESDIEIKTNGSFKLTAKDDIDIKSNSAVKLTAQDNIDIKSKTGDIFIQAEASEINLKGAADIKITAGGNLDSSAGGNYTYSGGGNVSGQAGGTMAHDGSQLLEQQGSSTPAQQASNATDATDANPKGERDS